MLVDATPSHINSIYELNSLNTSAVNDVSTQWFEEKIENPSFITMAYLIEGNVVGFFIATGAPYEEKSESFQHISKHLENFVFMERLVVSEKYQKMGVGKAIYKKLFFKSYGDYERIACEVEVTPENTGPLDFHLKLGFKEVAQYKTDDGSKTVSLLSWEFPSNKVKK